MHYSMKMAGLPLRLQPRSRGGAAGGAAIGWADFLLHTIHVAPQQCQTLEDLLGGLDA